jgi:hypothetical protein
MTSSLNIGASGLILNQKRLEGAAHNAASAAADEQVRVRVTGREGMHGGVRAAIDIGRAGGAAEAVEGQVEQIAAVQHARADVRVVQTQDEMLGRLLDIEA